MSATAEPAPAPPAGDPAPPQEWKPEPRQWTWKDLFTAPMLGFKPKCMIISALTLLLMGGWAWLFNPEIGKLMANSDHSWAYLAGALWLAVQAVIFSLGATLVAVFMRADLLDDEFLTWREAFTQFQGRLAPALLVPLFLIGLLLGVNLFLVWLPQVFCSIPYLGGALYALLYPIPYFLAIFAVLLLIAVVLSVFVFPGIIAIRKHGWFDNVVDTIEAVGTKPHVLVASLILTLLMMAIAVSIGRGAMTYLSLTGENMIFKWGELPQTDQRANDLQRQVFKPVDPLFGISDGLQRLVPSVPTISALPATDATETSAQELDTSSFYLDHIDSPQAAPSYSMHEKFVRYGTGPVLGMWKIGILAVLLGYGMNLLIGGGMLTYLLVREDDYWDDEDLEDLDKLAKELEEDAKREEAGGQAPAPAPAASPAAETRPSPPATPG